MTDVMKCPKCGGEMEEGYVRLSEGIRWRTRDRARGEVLRGELSFGLVITQHISAESANGFSSVTYESG
jgi:hypothetical protein